LPRLVNAIACHALNVLSSAWRYSEPTFLSYGLFPFLLWMFWRMEGLLQRAEKVPHHPNFWFTPIPSILADGFSAVALIPR